ncbi:MFS transporter [Kitasatospora purpeofusca]|uniref:MFS transporter n=1 Tax=Kitasatospora purpeofusca TaxID=67352 RepID=UPI0022583331|nr:MFS transporter [Kitasatospora purpeofusca]MCX4758578.1 MFS transporter [Kitasatospora purpeofusca]WSR30980.1 MFS transporter [Kitasatospora purpeofusca]
MPATAARPDRAAAPAAPDRRHRAVLLVTCLALATVVAAMASLNVALPDIARATGGSQTQLSWIIDAYSLVFAALLLPAGAIGDRFGRRRALLVGLAVFGAGSGLAALTTDPDALIGLRALLGVGAALVMPATLSTITSTFPPERRARGVAAWAAVAGAAAVLGLFATGLLLELWSWPSIFVLNVVLAVLALAGTLLFVPESAEPDAPRLDVVGALLAVAGLGSLVYAVIEAPVRGWADPWTLVGGFAGLALLAGFVRWELRRRHPLLDPRLFRERRFAAGTLSITCQFFAFFGYLFVIMQYLQLVRERSALAAAVALLPMALGMAPGARLSPRLTDRFGARGPWVAGLLLIAGALASLGLLDADSSGWLVAAVLFPLGLGAGLAMTPATTAITEALPSALQNVGSAMNDLARELGGALGIAVLGSVLTAGYRARVDIAGLPPQLADAARSSLAAASRFGPPVADRARDAFVHAMHLTVLTAAGVVTLAAVAVAVLLRGTTTRTGR